MDLIIMFLNHKVKVKFFSKQNVLSSVASLPVATRRIKSETWRPRKITRRDASSRLESSVLGYWLSTLCNKLIILISYSISRISLCIHREYLLILNIFSIFLFVVLCSFIFYKIINRNCDKVTLFEFCVIRGSWIIIWQNTLVRVLRRCFYGHWGYFTDWRSFTAILPVSMWMKSVLEFSFQENSLLRSLYSIPVRTYVWTIFLFHQN